MFLARGFDAASMGDIARAAGVSKGTLYVYFKNKEELFTAIVHEQCCDQAESFFSRLRRAEYGQHHRISGIYLPFYAGEMAWREDSRREANGDLYELATVAAEKLGLEPGWAQTLAQAHLKLVDHASRWRKPLPV